MSQQPRTDSVKPNRYEYPATLNDVVSVPVASIDAARRLRLVNATPAVLLKDLRAEDSVLFGHLEELGARRPGRGPSAPLPRARAVGRAQCAHPGDALRRVPHVRP